MNNSLFRKSNILKSMQPSTPEVSVSGAKKKKNRWCKKAAVIFFPTTVHTCKKKCSHSVFSPQKSRENKPTGPYFIGLLPTVLIDRWRKAGTADGAGHPWRHESGSRQDRTHDRRGSDGDPEVRVTSVPCSWSELSLKSCCGPRWESSCGVQQSGR